MSNSRFRAVEEAYMRAPVKVEPPARATSEYYGCNVFDRKNMRKYLSADTRRKIYESIEQGVTLDREVAEHVAAGCGGNHAAVRLPGKDLRPVRRGSA